MQESGSVYPVALRIEDEELRQDLTAVLASRPELTLSSAAGEPAVLITDRDDPGLRDDDTPVLLVGVGHAVRGQAVTAIRSRDPRLILSAAHLLAAGHRSVLHGLDDDDSAIAAEDDAAGRALPHLTTRERQVAELLVDGASNKVIARRLGISVHTAKFHVAAVMEKLGARNRADAVAIAIREGLVSL